MNQKHLFVPTKTGSRFCVECGKEPLHSNHIDLDAWEKPTQTGSEWLHQRAEAYHRAHEGTRTRVFDEKYHINCEGLDPVTMNFSFVADHVFLMLIEQGLQPVMTKTGAWKTL